MPVGDAVIAGVNRGAWNNSTCGPRVHLCSAIFNVVTILLLYQAGKSLDEHFNRVCVINGGQRDIFGPANMAKQYFIDLGFKPANRQTTADFPTAVIEPGAFQTESSEEENEERTPAIAAQKPGQTESESGAYQPDEPLSIQASERKLSKSHQMEAIRTYLLDSLGRIESETGQISSLLPRGKQKATLPWKTLTISSTSEDTDSKTGPLNFPFRAAEASTVIPSTPPHCL